MRRMCSIALRRTRKDALHQKRCVAPERLRPTRRDALVRTSSTSRTYEYEVDHGGLVHLAEVKRRTLATAYRDVKFLDDLYRGLRKRSGRWTSHCRGEVNVLKLAPGIAFDGIVVFHSLIDDHLGFAGTFQVPFRPPDLRYCKESGLFFHPLTQKHLGDFGLLGSHVAHDISPHLTFDEEDEVLFTYQGQRHVVQPI